MSAITFSPNIAWVFSCVDSKQKELNHPSIEKREQTFLKNHIRLINIFNAVVDSLQYLEVFSLSYSTHFFTNIVIVIFPAFIQPFYFTAGGPLLPDTVTSIVGEIHTVCINVLFLALLIGSVVSIIFVGDITKKAHALFSIVLSIIVDNVKNAQVDEYQVETWYRVLAYCVGFYEKYGELCLEIILMMTCINIIMQATLLVSVIQRISQLA